MDMIYENAWQFVYRNARPLDLARWQYHFEGGSREAVLNALSCYQNPDGGFGNAIEPDFWNPASTPVGCWAASNVLWELAFDDPSHPFVQGILRYLDSGADFDGGRWYNTVPTNNDHPHAIWWTCPNDTGIPSDNPTAALAGFILRFAEKGSALYRKGRRIAEESIGRYLDGAEPEMHLIPCYLQLLSYAKLEGETLPGADRLQERLLADIDTLLPDDPERWKTEYLPKPSYFIVSPDSPIPARYPALLQAECAFVKNAQLSDGSYPVTWDWATGYPEFSVAANWWKSDLIIKNLLLLRRVENI